MPWAAVKIEQSPFRECSWCLSLPKFPLSGLHGAPQRPGLLRCISGEGPFRGFESSKKVLLSIARL